MKRFNIIGVFGVLFFIAAIAFSVEETNKFFFPGDSGSSWTYQGPSSIFSVHKACGAFDASTISGLEDMYDVIEEEKPFFNAFYTNGAKMGPFGVFAASTGYVYGYNSPATLKTIQDHIRQEFFQVGATMNEFQILNWYTMDKWALYDGDSKSYPSWYIMPLVSWNYLDNKIEENNLSQENDTSVLLWRAIDYRGVGVVNITVWGTLFPVEYIVGICYMMDAFITKELSGAGYPQSLRLELHKKTEKVGLNGDKKITDEDVIESVWWLVSGIGPVKVKDNIAGTEIVLKDYKIIPWESQPGSGKAVNPGSGKVTTTWGNIKK